MVFVNYGKRLYRLSKSVGVLPLESTDSQGLSDQSLFGLDERVSLRNGDLQQIGDGLGGCQSEPIRTRVLVHRQSHMVNTRHWVALKSTNLSALNTSRKINGSVGEMFLI